MSNTSPDARRWYEEHHPIWEEALRRLMEDVEVLSEDAGQYREYRPKVTGRVKGYGRLVKKMQAHNLTPHEAAKRIYDIVGVRVVCHNLDDVHRAVSLMRGQARERGLEVVDIEDKIAEPPPSGYRSIHLKCAYDPDSASREFEHMLRSVATEKGQNETGFVLRGEFVSTGERAKPLLPRILCEIQVRTAIQDAWAMLSHADLYEEYEKMPPNLVRIYAHLAVVMDGVDKITQEVRGQAVDIKHPDVLPPAYEEDVNLAGLKRVFKKAFGADPKDELLEEALEILNERGITMLEPVEHALLSKKVREEIDSTYDYLLDMAPDANDYFLGAMDLVDAPDTREFQERVAQRFGIQLSEYECTECGHRMTSDDEERSGNEVGVSDPYCSKCINEALHTCVVCGTMKTPSEYGICDPCEEHMREE